MRLGCFLAGYNAKLMAECSEHSHKKLKRITSGMLIVGLLWAFIGYKFSNEYLKLGIWTSLIGAVVALFLVIQLERQLVLHVSKTRLVSGFRIALAILMALIGSTIVDQIIFQEDIENAREVSNSNKVNELLPQETKQIVKYQKEQDSIIKTIEKRIEDIKKEDPPRYSYIWKDKEVSYKTRDGKDTTVVKRFRERIPNPQFASQLESKDKTIRELRNKVADIRKQKTESLNKSIDIRKDLKERIEKRKPFLDELTIMFYEVLFKNVIALIFWFVLFLFMFCLEMMVLFATWGKKTDYEDMVEYARDKKSPTDESPNLMN